LSTTINQFTAAFSSPPALNTNFLYLINKYIQISFKLSFPFVLFSPPGEKLDEGAPIDITLTLPLPSRERELEERAAILKLTGINWNILEYTRVYF